MRYRTYFILPFLSIEFKFALILKKKKCLHPWDVTLSTAVYPYTCQIFAGTYCLHVHVRKVKLKAVSGEPPPPPKLTVKQITYIGGDLSESCYEIRCATK